MRFVLVHGFNVTDEGKGSIELLKDLLPGISHEFHYGWTDLIDVYHSDSNYAAALASLFQAVAFNNDEEIIPIGHSNGCLLIQRVCQSISIPNIKRAVYLSPALDADTNFPRFLKKVAVLYTRKDWVVKVASWLPFLDWGHMGATGPTKLNEGWYPLNCSDWSNGHSGWFAGAEKVGMTVRLIREFIDHTNEAPK